MRPATEPRCRDAGFTLVEMIVVIAITGVLAAALSIFGRRQIEAYLDVSDRAVLTDAADTALRRIGRDLQSALPNSVRVSGNILEFVPIKDAGRYRADFTPAAGGNPLDLTDTADTSFDVLGPTVTAVAGDRLVIYNLGQDGSDVYAGTSSRPLTTLGAGLATLGFSGLQFPFASPQHRFQVVGGPVSYECSGGALRRHWCYDFQAGQPLVFGALAAHPGCGAEQASVLVDNVNACTITYAPGALARNGLVSLRLTLQTANGERVDLMHQVEVLNAP